MARRLSEELERRIVRRLDGELSVPERERLTRELLRDPEARRRMEEYAAADERAAEALRAAFTHTGPAGLRDWESPRRNARGIGRRWAVRAAAAVLVAAAGGYLAYLLTPGGGDGPKPGPPKVAHEDRPAVDPPAAVEQLIWQVWDPAPEGALGGAHPASLTSPAGGDVSVPLPAIQGPRRTRRAVDRHLFRVYDGSDNTVYLLGVDRVRKTVHAVGKDL
jgi:hypothetical protein